MSLTLRRRIDMCFVCKGDELPEIVYRLSFMLLTKLGLFAAVHGRDLFLKVRLFESLISFYACSKPVSKLARLNK